MEGLETHPLFKVVESLLKFRSSLLTEEILNFNLILGNELIVMCKIIDNLTEIEINSDSSIYFKKIIRLLLDQIWDLFYCRQNAQDEIKSLFIENTISNNLLFDDLSSDSSNYSRKNNHSPGSIQILKEWLLNNLDDPYPSQAEKEMLCRQSFLTMTQLSDWFVNARRRDLIKMRQTLQ